MEDLGPVLLLRSICFFRARAQIELQQVGVNLLLSLNDVRHAVQTTRVMLNSILFVDSRLPRFNPLRVTQLPFVALFCSNSSSRKKYTRAKLALRFDPYISLLKERTQPDPAAAQTLLLSSPLLYPQVDKKERCGDSSD